MKKRVLFICVQNSARSQLAEELFRKYQGKDYEVMSAGLKPTDKINPFVIEVLRTENIDIFGKKTNSVFELYKKGELFDYVVTVCDDSREECPIFPGITHRIHLPFPDPAQFKGSKETIREKVNILKEDIKIRVKDANCPEFILHKVKLVEK